MEQLLVIVADEKEAAVLAVLELVQQHVRERARPLESSPRNRVCMSSSNASSRNA